MLRFAPSSSSSTSLLRRTTATKSSSSSLTSLATSFISKRSYTHAFVRPPMKAAIPSFATHRHDPVKGLVMDSDTNTIEVHRDAFMQQYNDLCNVLRNSSLADTVHVLPELGYIESMRAADILTGMGETLLPMPSYGMEHRRTELIDTIRFIRQCGGNNETVDILQMDEKAHGIGSDIVLLPTGFLIGVTSRTNTTCAGILQGTYSKKEESKVFPTIAANLPNLNHPVMDIVGFTGQSTIICWDNEDGLNCAEVISAKAARPWHFVKIEPGCFFVALSGGLPRYDVICDADFPRSSELLQKAGLRVLPINWSEPKKLGIGMRALILVLNFARGGYSGGGVFKQQQYVRKGSDTVGNSRGLNGKRSGSEGAPLYGQLLSDELPPPVFQPVPRYNAPLHRPGPPSLIDQFDTDHAGNVRAGNPMEETGGFDHSKVGPEKWQKQDEQEDHRRFRPGWRKR